MYVLYMHKKEPKKPPEYASEHVKLKNFLGACPQTPLAQSILWAPLFVFALGPSHLLGGPDSCARNGCPLLSLNVRVITELLLLIF